MFRLGYGRRRRTGFRGRWIIALIIAAIGIITYYTNTQKNPVTGEKQRVALGPPEAEVALGLQAAPEMVAQMGGGVDPSHPDARLVDEVGAKLIRQLPRDIPWKFEFHLLADPQTVNAFALPGGQVFITRALLDQMQNEAQLAGVLGHEIGHVIERHGAEHMATGQLGQTLALAVGVGASDERGGGYSAAVIAQMVNQMVQLKYSREDELESDSYGLRYMTEAGYNPAAMLEVMNILERASASGGGRGPSFMQTHPDPGARREKIKAFLQENFPNGVPPELSGGRPLR